MSDPREKIFNGVILAVLGGACISVGALTKAPPATLFGGVVVVVGVADIVYGIWKMSR